MASTTAAPDSSKEESMSTVSESVLPVTNFSGLWIDSWWLRLSSRSEGIDDKEGMSVSVVVEAEELLWERDSCSGTCKDDEDASMEEAMDDDGTRSSREAMRLTSISSALNISRGGV